MKPGRYHIEALARGLRVLELFSREKPALSLPQVVLLSGLTKATAFRILSTLEGEGFVQRDAAPSYRPTLKVLRLGFSALSGFEIRQAARPVLELLSQELDLTASLSVLDGLEVVYIDRVRNQAIVGVLLGIGARIPAHCTSMGKVLLAYLPKGELDRRLRSGPLTPCTSQTLTEVRRLKSELEKIRRQGYALNDGELASGLRAVAAPIFDARGRVMAAINVSGSQDVISPKRLRAELPSRVKEAARHISQAVGFDERKTT